MTAPSVRRARPLLACLAPLLVLLCAASKLAAQDPRAAEDHFAAAKRYAESRQTDRAIEEYRKAIAAAPDAWCQESNPWRCYSYMLGEYLLASTERWAEALEAFRNAWDKGYQRGITRHKIALALHRLGKDDQALAELERAIELNRAALDTARARDQVSLLRYQIVDSYVWQANIHRERRDYDKIYQVLAAAVDFDPSRKELLAREHLASASRHAQSGTTHRAIQEYRKAIAAAPDDWQYSYKLGEYLLASTVLWAEALEAFRNAWDKGYQRGITRHKIALALHRLGKDDEALAELERAIEMNRAALDTARASDQAALLRYQIADDYFWHSR
ncbi:MAG: tetratricopeptide repeat protein, partial [Gemmatimonadetes bacterium]|nr:tetratricopeptide repeat protein [Gemmatimonadota bacterium]